MRRRAPVKTSSTEHADELARKMDEYWNRLTVFVCRPRVLLAVVLLIFLATRLWLLLAFEPQAQDSGYYSYRARQGIDCKLVVYRDFPLEYPPVAWWLMTVPRLVDSTSYAALPGTPETIARFSAWYHAWFHGEMFLADAICWGLMFLLGRRISATAQWALPAAYTLLTLAQPHLIYERLDVGLLMFFLLCTYCWARSVAAANRRAADLWGAASYLFLGLGISFKIMPIVLVPFLLLADAWAAGSARSFVGRIVALVVGAVGPFLVHLPSAGWSVFLLFRYHAERGVHMESVWGSMMLVARACGVPCEVVQSHSGFNLTGGWSGPLAVVSSVALATTAASFGLWALLHGRRFDRTLALDTAFLVLINCTVLAHVFSPQYLNWLLPLALLLALNLMPRSQVTWWVLAVAVIAIVGISSWLFPLHYLNGLVRLETWPLVLSVIRSVCLVLLALLLNISFFARYGLNPWRASGATQGPLTAMA
ncbi:MAG TPA: hypothetical protein VHY91_02360 [Pirellulales bacterium]|nr:hypothetical protein [Pirellulales bacterium]